MYPFGDLSGKRGDGSNCRRFNILDLRCKNLPSNLTAIVLICAVLCFNVSCLTASVFYFCKKILFLINTSSIYYDTIFISIDIDKIKMIKQAIVALGIFFADVGQCNPFIFYHAHTKAMADERGTQNVVEWFDHIQLMIAHVNEHLYKHAIFLPVSDHAAP